MSGSFCSRRRSKVGSWTASKRVTTGRTWRVLLCLWKMVTIYARDRRYIGEIVDERGLELGLVGEVGELLAVLDVDASREVEVSHHCHVGTGGLPDVGIAREEGSLRSRSRITSKNLCNASTCSSWTRSRSIRHLTMELKRASGQQFVAVQPSASSRNTAGTNSLASCSRRTCFWLLRMVSSARKRRVRLGSFMQAANCREYHGKQLPLGILVRQRRLQTVSAPRSGRPTTSIRGFVGRDRAPGPGTRSEVCS